MELLKRKGIQKFPVVLSIAFVLLCVIAGWLTMGVDRICSIAKNPFICNGQLYFLLTVVQIPGEIILVIFNLQPTDITGPISNIFYMPSLPIIFEIINSTLVSTFNGLAVAPFFLFIGWRIDTALTKQKTINEEEANAKETFFQRIPFVIKLPGVYILVLAVFIYLLSIRFGSIPCGASFINVCLSWPALFLFFLAFPGIGISSDLLQYSITKQISVFLYQVAELVNKEQMSQDFIVSYIINIFFLL